MSSPVVVVGGGITGLATAHELTRNGVDVVLLERTGRVGGKIDAGPVGPAGTTIDSGPDGFLARQPEVADLCRELGLGDDLVAPVGGGAFLWADGALRPIPGPSILGVPLDVDAVAASGIVSAAGVADLRDRIDVEAPPLVGDATVGEVVRPRVGDEVFERLVDPLIGGINAGSADELSITAGAPQLADAAREGGNLRTVLRAQVGGAATTGGPVFLGIRGGLHRLVAALGDELGDRVRTGQAVTEIARRGDRWLVRTERTTFDAEHVVVTTPAWMTAGLIGSHAPDAAAILGAITYADVALLTLVVDANAIDHPLDGSGFLVPRDQGLSMTACSWASSKWDHYDDGTNAVLRVSVGRTDDTTWRDLAPEDLIASVVDELALTIGLTGEPDVRITPWRSSLPQYRPGHLDRADRIDEMLAADAPGVGVAGAAMRGLGLPACVRQGRAAAHRILGDA